MNISQLRRAIKIVRDQSAQLHPRRITYLRTYGALINFAMTQTDDPHRRFLRLAAMAYGWMPRVVRIDGKHITTAIEAFQAATAASGTSVDESLVYPIKECLHTVVGTSKVLHFANPHVYPIWDAKVEQVWIGGTPSAYYMSQPRKYVEYANEVHQMRKHKGFKSFLSGFRGAYEARLKRLGIPGYKISEIRAIEAAAFELSGGLIRTTKTLKRPFQRNRGAFLGL